jgi:hypothetical protein
VFNRDGYEIGGGSCNKVHYGRGAAGTTFFCCFQDNVVVVLRNTGVVVCFVFLIGLFVDR